MDVSDLPSIGAQVNGVSTAAVNRARGVLSEKRVDSIAKLAWEVENFGLWLLHLLGAVRVRNDGIAAAGEQTLAAMWELCIFLTVTFYFDVWGTSTSA